MASNFKEIEFQIGASTRIILCGSDNNKIRSREAQNDPYCEITTEIDVEERNLEILLALEKGSIGEKIEGIDEYKIYVTPRGHEFLICYSQDFPDYFQLFIKSTQKRLSESVHVFISAIRWRMDLVGSNKPIRFGKFEWSKEGMDWQEFKYSFSFPHVDIFKGLNQSEKLPKNDIEELLKEFRKEPVHHILFRESWELRYAHPRSAIVVGVSAAEVAMKECISTLVPDAQWLAEEAPTPPLAKMMSNYLPMLPAKNKFNGEVLALPSRVRKEIQSGVEIRNKVVHAGLDAPNHEKIESILLAVKDFLWLIDYYCGYSWSVSHIREKTLGEMGVDLSALEPFSINWF